MRLQPSWTPAGGPVVRRLSAGLLLSRTGDQLTTIAMLWFVLDLTGSGVAVGLVLLCAGLPPVVTGPLLGRVLDRWPVRQVLIADNLLRAALIGAIPVLYWTDRLNMPLVYGLSLAAGALLPATDVGVRVVLPRLVDEPELEPANAMLSIGDQVSALVGPAVAGVLVGLVGAPPVLLLDAASFLAMATLVRSLPDTPAPAAAPPPARGSAGRLLLRGPTVRTVLALTLIYFLAYGPLEPALPLYSRDVLHAGPGGYGLLWPAFGAGALLGLATIPVVSRLRPGIALAGNALLWGGDPSAPGRHHQYRPGGPRPCRWRAGLGALHHPGSVPAATSRPSLPARLGVRGPPGRDRCGRTARGRRRRAPPRPRRPEPDHRPVRRHLHPRRRGRALLPGPPPPPDPAHIPAGGMTNRRW